MHRQVNAISGRLSLRPPQRYSLEILDRVIEITQPPILRRRSPPFTVNFLPSPILSVTSRRFALPWRRASAKRG